MYSYIIKGGSRLKGTVTISGSKNASLPILAATLLNGKTTKLYNVPNIEDVRTTIKILEELGCKIKKEGNKLTINSKDINQTIISDELMRKLRSSVIIAGAIIGRKREVKLADPGGCDIGCRPSDLHLKAFEKIGIKIDENTRYIECKCDKIQSTIIQLDFPSVGATENIILASVLGKDSEHEIIIKNAAREPEIIDLISFLNRMGAKITGAGTSEIVIKSVRSLKEVSYRIMPDRIEAGTILVSAAMTSRRGKIRKC